jgi:hypothetical protein
MTLLMFGCLLISLISLFVICYCCIRFLLRRLFSLPVFIDMKNKDTEPKPAADVRVLFPNKTIVSRIMEENKRHWLKNRAGADLWSNEQGNRQSAKILKFPSKT